jgi:uncharacterized repeat protein (TIGR02543 family)
MMGVLLFSLSGMGNVLPQSLAATEIHDLTAQEANSLIQNNSGSSSFVIMDVRTPAEYATGSILNAININFSAGDFSSKLEQMDRDKTYLIYCQTGARSSQAGETMAGMEFTSIYTLDGGLNAWVNAGHPIYVWLQIQIDGQGTVNPTGGNYPPGATIEVTATPNDGWQFSQWNGDVTGTNPAITLEMDSNKSLILFFLPVSDGEEYTLLTDTVGEGSITIEPQQEKYVSGTVVTLTATPAEGWHFNRWNGYRVWPGGVSDAYTPTVNFTMDTNKSITAYFYQDICEPVEIPDANLRAAILNKLGRATTDDVCLSEIQAITHLNAYAMGVTDLSGLENFTNLEIANLYSNDITDISPLQYCTKLTAIVLMNNRIEDITPLVNNTGIGASTTIWLQHNQLSLEPGPDMDNIAALQARGVVIEYEPQGYSPSPIYTLTTAVSGNGTIQLSPPDGTYPGGTEITLQAIPDAGYAFAGWSGDITGTSNPCSVIMDSDKAVTATFTEITGQAYTLTINTTGSGIVSRNPSGGNYPEGTTVQLSATPSDGYKFVGWSGDVTGTSNPCSVVMNADKSITAAFAPTSSPTSGGGGGGISGGGGGGGGSSEPVPTSAQKIYEAKDEMINLFIPAGTLFLTKYGANGSYVQFREIAEECPPVPEGKSVLCRVYKLAPEEATFDPAARLTFLYDKSKLPQGLNPDTQTIFNWNDDLASWTALETIHDPNACSLSADITHLSIFTVMAATTPADISVSDLRLSRKEITMGETVTVSVTVNNAGDLGATHTVSLEINGAVSQSKSIFLYGGESQTLEFQVKPETAASYSIRIEDISTTMTVTSPAPEPTPPVQATTVPIAAAPVFKVLSLEVLPEEITAGDNAIVRIGVENSGTAPGKFEVSLMMNGKPVGNRILSILAGSSRTETFVINLQEEGDYLFKVESLTKAVTAKASTEMPAEAKSTGTWLIIIGLIGAAVLMVAIVVIYFKSRSS